MSGKNGTACDRLTAARTAFASAEARVAETLEQQQAADDRWRVAVGEADGKPTADLRAARSGAAEARLRVEELEILVGKRQEELRHAEIAARLEEYDTRAGALRKLLSDRYATVIPRIEASVDQLRSALTDFDGADRELLTAFSELGASDDDENRIFSRKYVPGVLAAALERWLGDQLGTRPHAVWRESGTTLGGVDQQRVGFVVERLLKTIRARIERGDLGEEMVP